MARMSPPTSLGVVIAARCFTFGVMVQCHDGASSNGLADTIKNTIILMVLPMDSGG